MRLQGRKKEAVGVRENSWLEVVVEDRVEFLLKPKHGLGG